VAVALLAAVGCGKSNLVRPASAPSATTVPRLPKPSAPSPSVPGARQRLKRAVGEAGVAVPLALTAARAAAFERGVELRAADLPGARAERHGPTPRRQAEEAAKCGGRSTRAIGGGRSADLVRGRGLERESISSSVLVLADEATVARDIEYAESKAGLECYARIVGRNLAAEQRATVHVLGVHVTRIRVQVPGREVAAGIRIAARVGVPSSQLAVSLYSDALSLAYGPAELDLYATSFVQPEPVRSEQQLLTLMRDRARRGRL
jgi:hypothetical protein